MNIENIVKNYNAIDPEGRRGQGDIDYCLHEIAHFVVIFRRAPRVHKGDPHEMQLYLDELPCGLAQLHELRVIKLQHLVQRTSRLYMLRQVMWGIREVAETRKRGQRDIVTSETLALRMMRDIKVSPRLVRAFRHAIERFST